MNLTIIGHSYNRRLILSDSGEYRELSMPAGACFLAQLLNESDADIPVNATEYIQLIKKNNSCSFGNSMGFKGAVTEARIGSGDNIVIFDEGFGISDNIPNDKEVFWSSEKCLPPVELFNKIKQNVFLMLDADVLRSNGALISKQVSWERTSTDLLWQFKNNPKFSYLIGTKYIFIVFAEEAGVLMCGDCDEFSAQLTLYNGETEGALRAEKPTNIPDTWLVKTTNAVIEWFNSKSIPETFFINFNVRNVFDPSVQLKKVGYSFSAIENGIFESFKLLESYEKPLIFNIPEPMDRQKADPDYWCLSHNLKSIKLSDLAFDYVNHGREIIEWLPKFVCGGLTTIDRREIEAFQNIKNLITEYGNTKNPKRPLSIAVFGAPGSGKSFGVKQIAKTLYKELIEPLEVNISQIADPNDLNATFHQVRDNVLIGKLPLVFFDEFDSNELCWLKYFLAPMQDGEFRDESGVHPIGKCIFVFAGGTSASFDKFIEPMSVSTQQSEDKRYLNFKNMKSPDFVSRLRGTIDIFGPNRLAGSDEGFILRRAILLRSLLERKGLVNKKDESLVSADIIRAMLLVPKYEHGARSMEAILDMSRMEGASFEPVSLPFYTQMKLHLDADAFIRLVLKDVILNGSYEELAEAIHEDYRAQQKESGAVMDINVDKPWADLSDDYKNSNRRQARDIPRKLSLIGCAFDSGDAPYSTVKSFTADEIKLLAADEHDRWMEERKASGWEYCAVSDKDNKKHKLLVPFDELPDEEIQKDINAVKNIFKWLEKAKLRVYRVV